MRLNQSKHKPGVFSKLDDPTFFVLVLFVQDIYEFSLKPSQKNIYF